MAREEQGRQTWRRVPSDLVVFIVMNTLDDVDFALLGMNERTVQQMRQQSCVPKASSFPLTKRQAIQLWTLSVV